jgi:hypothetical protein
MRRARIAAAPVLLLMALAGTASAQCVTEVREIYSRSNSTSLVAGPFAWNGQMLAVASRQASNKSVWVSFFSEAGDQLFPNVKVPSSDDSELIDILWTGTEFGLFYETEDHRLILRRVSTTGELIGPSIEPMARQDYLIGDLDQLDLMWSPFHHAYLIARTVNAPVTRLYLTTIESTGVVRSDEQIATTAPESLVRIDVTTSNTVTGIFYEQEGTRHIMLAATDEDGDFRELRKVWSTTGDDLVIDARANDFVLARTQTQGDGRKTIRWKIVDQLGRDVRQEARLVIGTGLDVAPLSLMARGDEIILTYLDSRDGFENQIGNYRIRRVNTDGDTLIDTFFAATDSGRRRAQTPYDFVWTGNAFVAIVVRDTDAGDDSFLVRLCALKAEISGPRVMHPGDTVTFTGTAEGGVPPYSYVWRWDFFSEAFGPTPQIRFDTAGTYVLTLTITDDTGSIATDTFEVTVAPQVKPRRRSVRK